jgi:hypothetical protein
LEYRYLVNFYMIVIQLDDMIIKISTYKKKILIFIAT